ncbi:SDR family NAD(P)-dependent oxidoreductase [Granulicella rosea]|nr:SDR family oxidoreductase [Granulicella rosea]
MPQIETQIDPTEHLLVLGASGAIGHAVCLAGLARGWMVTGAARAIPEIALEGLEEVTYLAVDPLSKHFEPEQLRTDTPYTAVCWAQGANLNDSVYNVDLDKHRQIYEANVVYILATMKALLEHDLLAPKARMVVISSIWQNLAKQSKLSYCVSKSALQGLVLSAAADLAVDGHLINAVLPGAIDTPMTRHNLHRDQIEALSAATGFGRMPTLTDVSSLVCFLCSPENTGITGQFIAADLGFSHVRIL